MYKYVSPQNFSTHNGVAALEPTDEYGRSVVRLPVTIEEANGIEREPDAPVEASAEAKPYSDLEARARTYAEKVFHPALKAVMDYLAYGEEFETRRAELLTDLWGIRDRVALFFGEARAARDAALTAEHEQVYAECRAVRDQRAALEMELGATDSVLRRVQEKRLNADLRHKTEHTAKPSPESYPTAAEKRAWENRVEKARAAFDEAALAENKVIAERNSIFHRIAALQARLDDHIAAVAAVNDADREGLVSRERRLRLELQGRGYATPLGLPVPPAEF